MDFLITTYNTVFFAPLFNALVFLTSVVPGKDLGLAVILLTIIVRFVIFPFTHRSIKTQAKMREIEPHLKKIREDFKDNKEEQAKRTMELYRAHGVSPFSGCLLLLIQLPILIALYRVFIVNNISPDSAHLYSFINFPENIQYVFWGVIDMKTASVFLAVLAAISQFIQMKLAIPPGAKSASKKTAAPDMTQAMTTQAPYIFPFLVLFIAIRFPAAVALYWTTSNIFAIVHEGLVRQRAKTLAPANISSNPSDHGHRSKI